MKIETTSDAAPQISADVVIVTSRPDGELSEAAQAIDAASGGAITRLVDAGEVTGKENEVVGMLALNGVAAVHVLVLGLGSEEVTRGVLFRAVGSAVKHAAGKQRQQIAVYLPPGLADDVASAAVCGAYSAVHGQDLYRAEKKLHPCEQLVFSGISAEALEAGESYGQSVTLTRRLVNEPPNAIYPESFAAEAQQVAERTGLEIEIWDQQKLEEERCGSLLAVARGSSRPPRLVMLKHLPNPDQAPLALVGKGVTFDSGGLSLKPSEGMADMKCDMAGAATVVGAMQAIAMLNLPVNVIGLVGLVENMVSGDSYKLGDVLTARSGKTIEVLNTDAEGRLVLADVLDVAVTSGASRIIDLATLTGACMVALGTDVCGLMTNEQEWCEQVKAAADRCGEFVWQLPMHKHYNELIKSEVADIKNIGQGRWAGAITAAKLLEEFVGDTPWVHLDIAGPAFRAKPKSWVDAGASGEMVRTLVEVAQSLAKP